MIRKQWRSPSASRRTVHAETKDSGCPLSPDELRILVALKQAEARDPDTTKGAYAAAGEP